MRKVRRAKSPERLVKEALERPRRASLVLTIHAFLRQSLSDAGQTKPSESAVAILVAEPRSPWPLGQLMRHR